ncbi:IclR family transcriptional regulator [Rhodobacteraceae bacterium CCMM004]|nr:IclR family transcriptional regulator [Rhodobacteraceae bacterium CCMM004]
MNGPKERKTGDPGDAYVVASVERAAQLLLTLAEMPDAGVTDLAEATGTTKSLTFRLLYTLERNGFVRKDAERRTYTLGYRTLVLGDQSRRQSQLIATAEPVLESLVEETRENALLFVREGTKGLCVALRESPQPLRIFASVGRLVPLYAGGATKVLLAYAPDEVQAEVAAGPLERFTPSTPSDSASLSAALERIRSDGYVRSVGEIEPDTCSIAAPVRDQTGGVIAALGVNGPTARMTDAVTDAAALTVMSAAAGLSRALGWRPGPTGMG